MFKKLMTLAVAASMTFCFALVTADTASANAGDADMVLKTAAAKKPAAFPHKKHQDMYPCAECHHGADAGKQAPYVAGEEKKCESCHNADFGNAKLNSFKAAAHENCKKCHEAAAKEGKNAPTKCAGCHVKGL
jgi:hypothetical protein